MDSSNVFADDWGLWLQLGPGAVMVIGALGLTGWIVSRFKVPRFPAAALVLLALGGAFLGAISLPIPSYVGEHQELYRLRGPFGERLAITTYFYRGGRGASAYHHLLVFELPGGREVGRVELPSRGRRTRVALKGWLGRRAWFSSPEGYLIVDAASAQLLAREGDFTAQLGEHRTQGFDPGTWSFSVLLQNGKTLRVPAGPPPAREGVTVAPVRVDYDCTSHYSGRRRPSPKTIAGLLRAIPVFTGREPCRFQLGGESLRLYLHRNTAFGEGATLLTALSDKDERRWTLDIPAPAADVDVLLAEVIGGQLRILVGARKTVYLYEIDPAKKQAVSRALY